MTASRISAAALAVALAASPVLAAAQNAPVPLFPAEGAPPSTEAQPSWSADPLPGAQPVRQLPQEDAPLGEEERRRDVVPVQTQELAPVGVGAVGVLDDATDGLGVDMWSGTRLVIVQRLLPEIPATSDSSALRDLARRLLLTTSRIPQGQSNGASLLRLRTQKLIEMGLVDDALALIAAIPATAKDAGILTHQAQAMLLQGDIDGLCSLAPDLLRAGGGDYAAKVQIFCQLREGREGEANLGLGLLRETGHEDPVFFLAADAMQGLKSGIEIPSITDPTALHIVMLREAGLPLPDSFAQSRRPGILALIALAPNASVQARLTAAQNAENWGVLSPDDLRALYNSTTFTEAELAEPLADSAAALGVRHNALLYRAAKNARAARAELIVRALAQAGAEGRFVAEARIFAPLIAEMSPSDDLLWFSGHAARALLAAGDLDGANTWYDAAQAARPRSAEAVAVSDGLWPLIRLARGSDSEPRPDGVLAAWRKTRIAASPEAEHRRNAIVYGMLDALGEPMRSEDWVTQMDAPVLMQTNLPRPSIWHGLRIAAEDLRLGETVLLSLVSLGEDGPARADSTNLYRVVSSLRLLGLSDEARALALEAALANGA